MGTLNMSRSASRPEKKRSSKGKFNAS